MNGKTIDGEGIHSAFEPRAGDEALLERRLTFLNETTFEDVGDRRRRRLLEHATGRIVSNFLLQRGKLTDRQLGVVFVDP